MNFIILLTYAIGSFLLGDMFIDMGELLIGWCFSISGIASLLKLILK